MKASKAFLFVFLIVLSLCLFTTQHTQSQSSGTIYIRADGTVEGTDKIQRDGNVYTFTDNIFYSIVAEKDNIVVDGAGYILQGTGAYRPRGIDLSGRSNVTIKNMRVSNTHYGIHLDESLNNNIIGNYIIDNSNIALYSSSNNNVTGNNVANNNGNGIYFVDSSKNFISGNNITNNNSGIWLEGSSNNTISGNNVINNYNGIWVSGSSNNNIYHNNFINNHYHVFDISMELWYAHASVNIWDNGVEGNYWGDYEARYPNTTELDGSGIWDTPYVIYGNNQDNYPLMEMCSHEGVKFEHYVSTFHLLFEDESHNLLGNLSGELRITEPEKEIIHSICKLSLSSPRPDEYHKPYIDKVELFLAWFFIIHPWGPVEIPQPPPSPEKVTLDVNEEIILFEHSHNVSGFVEEPRLVFWFSSGAKISNHEWGTMILPTIRVYFSGGQKWEWEYEYDITPPFKLWSGMDVNLSELSGKVETETITFTTVGKVNPPIIDLLTYLYIILASTIIVAIAVAAVFIKYRKKQ